MSFFLIGVSTYLPEGGTWLPVILPEIITEQKSAADTEERNVTKWYMQGIVANHLLALRPQEVRGVGGRCDQGMGGCLRLGS